MPQMEKLEVKPSPIHGDGLFATKTIRKGIIGKLHGKTLSRKQANKQAEHPHLLWDVNEKVAMIVEGPLAYLNHSSDPNAEYSEDGYVRALKKIKKGEEITHDYGW